MSLPETLLRQKSLLSFLTTTLLIGLTTQSSLAFSINPPGPIGATQDWVPSVSYTLNDQSTGTTTLSPTAVRSISRGGTAGFLATLRRAFPTWIFNSAANDLAGSLEVRTYEAVGTSSTVGANLDLWYTPGAGDPTAPVHRINWIQRIVSNHNGNDHGSNQDIIDNGSRTGSPYYRPGFSNSFFAQSFDSSPRLPDPNRNHDWLAELYMVEETGPQQVTIYNGIQWGWNNRVESVPEPLTIFAAGISLGFGALFKKTVKGTGQNKSS
jgi:hypothetical protein